MEESRKREGDENDEEAVAVKRARTPSMSEETDKSSDADFYEDITALLSIGDEAESELSKLLETETTSHQKVRFIDDPYNSLSPIFQSSSSYVTINGNEESCGSSFSEMESSVMAGVDIVRRGNWIDDGWSAAEDAGAWLNDCEAASGGADAEAAGCAAECFFEEETTSGCDCVDVYDEMLARFIGEEEFPFQ
ncbi:hypothetical protein Vadar_014390 [Vaccinium darrowii]|uniref:Uncharacterized protein n=1 Tax=Vaccinium darrowii TaxID=229202 RepID=A0ACB7YMX2_9ERIC|nr:hypothetical protein Vadar_014390 [Vaccinium darrowii]